MKAGAVREEKGKGEDAKRTPGKEVVWEAVCPLGSQPCAVLLFLSFQLKRLSEESPRCLSSTQSVDGYWTFFLSERSRINSFSYLS